MGGGEDTSVEEGLNNTSQIVTEKTHCEPGDECPKDKSSEYIQQVMTVVHDPRYTCQ